MHLGLVLVLMIKYVKQNKIFIKKENDYEKKNFTNHATYL